MKVGLMSALAAGLIMTGCSTGTETIVVYERVLIGDESREYIHKEETMATTESRKLGAAIHPASLIHVLGKRDDPFDANLEDREELVNKIKEGQYQDKSELKHQLADLEAQSGKKGISYYDAELWQKYCNGGDGLSRNQILQLHLFGAEVMPKSLVETCEPPKIEIR